MILSRPKNNISVLGGALRLEVWSQESCTGHILVVVEGRCILRPKLHIKSLLECVPVKIHFNNIEH